MNKKFLAVLSGIVLSGSMLLSGNVYANYPENYQGATASDGRVDVSSVNYNGDTISLNLQLKNLDHFAVEDVHKLWFDLIESGEVINHLDTTVNIVDEEKGLVQFNFNINDLKKNKIYAGKLYTEHSFAAILIPDTTFNIGNKEVTIKNSVLTVTEENTLSNEETTQIQNKTVNTNKEETVDLNDESQSSKSATTNTPKKTLPATKAVR